MFRVGRSLYVSPRVLCSFSGISRLQFSAVEVGRGIPAGLVGTRADTGTGVVAEAGERVISGRHRLDFVGRSIAPVGFEVIG